MKTRAGGTSYCFSLQWAKMWQLSPRHSSHHCPGSSQSSLAICVVWLDTGTNASLEVALKFSLALASALAPDVSVSTCRITSELPSKRSTVAAQGRPSSWGPTSPQRMCVSSVLRSLRWRILKSTASSSSLMKRGSSWQRTLILKRSRLSCTAGLSPTYSTLSTSGSRMILTAWFSRMGKISLPHKGHMGLPIDAPKRELGVLPSGSATCWAWKTVTSSRTPSVQWLSHP